jgi:transposase
MAEANPSSWCLGLRLRGEDTGERSAILYTVIETAKRHGHEPHAYLKDVLERLPATRTTGLDALLPANWQPIAAKSSGLLATA